MYKQFIKKLASPLILSFLVATPSVMAAKIDIEQEIIIKAKRQEGDLKNKIASYLDEVSITQGSLTILADVVQVLSQTENDHKVYIAKGNPAKFQQLLEDGSPINLQANEIRYEPALHTITISGNALLSQAGSEVSGSKITYNTQTEKLAAESNKNEAVVTILKPQAKNDKKK
jgi:lipopolysaccharide export system protein LptA